MLPKTLRNFTVFVDGVGYAGRVTEGTPPTLTEKAEEFTGGGMVGTVDIPMGMVEKMEFEVTIKEVNPAIIGKLGEANVPVTFRGAQGPDAEAVVIETRGLMREIDHGSWTAGESGELKFGMTATYLKETIAGAEVVEIDVENFIYKTGGVDRLAGVSSALGL